jgi:hypothetical protein
LMFFPLENLSIYPLEALENLLSWCSWGSFLLSKCPSLY